MFLITKTKSFLLLISLVVLFFLNTRQVSASTTDGTIPTDSFAWGENLSWINFGTSTGNIHVTNTAITGYAWSQDFGWINLSPTNGGITNNASGTLGGNAWSSGKGGWIPFDGVTINSSGKFTGQAGISGTDAGRINFDCTYCNVTTDWRPSSGDGGGGASTTSTSGGGGGGGGGAPALTPALTPAQFPFSGPSAQNPPSQCPSATSGQLFDTAAQPLIPSAVSTRANLIKAGVIIFASLVILFSLLYYLYLRFKLRKNKRLSGRS